MALYGPFDFTQGLNTRAGIHVTPRTQCSTLQGFYPDYLSIKNQNDFYSITGSSPLTVNSRGCAGIAYWEDPATTAATGKIIVVVNDSKIWRVQYQESGASTTFTDCTGTATVHNGSNISYQMDSLNGLLFGIGNSAAADPVFKLSGSGGNCANLGGTPPKGECIKVVNNFAFIGGDITSSTTKSKVSWSNVNDPETWTAANFVTVSGGDGDIVTAFGSIATDLFIFKRRSIWRLSATTTTISGAVTLGPLTKVSDLIGVFSKWTVDNLPDGSIVFLGSDLGLYRLDGTTVQKLSDFVPPGPSVQPSLISNYYALSGLAFPGVTLKAYPPKNAIILANGTGTACFAYDYIKNLWYQPLDDSNGIYCMATAGATRPDNSRAISHGLILGTGNGLVEIFDVVSGAQSDNICVVNLPLPEDQKDFNPRSLILTMETGGYVNVRFGLDGTYASSDALSITNAARNKYIIPINNMADVTLGNKHKTLNIKLTCPATRTATIYPLYVSDEVLT